MNLPLASATLGRTSSSHLRLLAEGTEDLCSIETEALQNDSSFVSASTQMYELCPTQEEILSSSEISMTVDYSTCSYADEYEIACTNAGGKVDILEGWMCHHIVQYDGQTMTITASQLYMPLCFGQSCTGSVSELSLYQGVVADAIESELNGKLKCGQACLSLCAFWVVTQRRLLFTAVGISADCEVGSASSVILSKLVVVGGLVVLLSSIL